MENPQEFRINDFYQSVVLLTAGLPLLRLEKISPKQSIFIFQDSDDKAEGIISDYWNHKLNYDPKLFVENINELKTRLYT